MLTIIITITIILTIIIIIIVILLIGRRPRTGENIVRARYREGGLRRPAVEST